LLILLDEPFTGIDPHTVADIQKIVRDLREFGIGILVTDHHVRETLTITDRSYIIKAGRVLTEGTPQQIIKDEVAIREYIGNSFAEDPFAVVGNGSRTSAAREAPPAASAPPAAAAAPVAQVLEQEKAHRLVEQLRGEEHTLAAVELLQLGPGAVPALLEALERRDVEVRRRACDVLRAIFQGTLDFDPYAPEQQRRQQIAALRDRHVRRAG
jgi:lipopolysaccharide export system ATP-binding protein